MQRGQRRAQIVRDIGDQVAPLLVLTRQLAPLVGYPPAHLHEAAPQHRDLVPVAVRRVARTLQRGQRLAVVAIKSPHRPGQAAQWPRNQGKRSQARHQAQQGHQRDRPQRRAQDRAARHGHRQRIVRLALQHHVDITLVLPRHPHGRRAEHLLHPGIARVVAHDGQHAARDRAVREEFVDGLGGQAAQQLAGLVQHARGAVPSSP
ncbi:hypothetical protein G6F35_014751 [Rhizopus arrhizus]|nr:hypothetical protein G6F35_014751 [Rhizopus arrhizus]